MSSLTTFALREEYKRLESLGDKLSEIESLIDSLRTPCMISSAVIE